MTGGPPRLTWRTRKPAELARHLEQVLGRANAATQADAIGAVRAHLALRFGDGDELDVDDWAGAGREADDADIILEVSVLALGWATVELDRWGACEPFVDDLLLGARTAVPAIAPPSLGAMLPVLLLEPSTEGRVAARLARHGEGPAVAYLAAEGSWGRAGTFGDRRTGSSAFGLSSLAVDPRHGPFLVTCPGPYPPLPRPRTIEP